MRKNRFCIIITVVIILLAIFAIGMVLNADHAHFMETMKALI